MENARLFSGWAKTFALPLVAMIIYTPAQAYRQTPEQKSDRARADIIYIEKMKFFGNLERPGVVFPHDLHASMAQTEKKNCSACHLPEKNRLSLKFKRLQDTDKNEVMNIYHDNCIGCHIETADKKTQTGPTACGECHSKTPEYVSSAQPAGFDKSLHHRHSKSQEDNCGTCHHEYDEKTKKLIYNKGKEGSCRYCHQKTAEENRISMKEASHISCIECHLTKMQKKKEAGPIQCEGCHDPAKKSMIKKISDIPRVDRKQPDFLMINANINDNKQMSAMNSVPFNHKAHEEYNDSCMVCHHKNLSACSSCHSTKGIKDGNFVSLEQSMHQSGSIESCIGCHDLKKKDRNCSGCHGSMGTDTKDSSCYKCHMEQTANIGKNDIKTANNTSAVPRTSQDISARLAETMLRSKKAATETYKDEDIPDQIVISALSEKYEPVKFPHKKIISALEKNINNSRIASYFHNGRDSICQGCHHNAPASTQPIKCGSCHINQTQDKESSMPGIKGAYHMQCMGCHKEMGIEKPASCTDCHNEKTNEQHKQ